ncbi:MAG: leucine--tRNA ligase [Rikenellaceae bacterium]
MEYNFKEIEKKWQEKWVADQIYKVEIDHSRPKFYILDMFPYPSGAGLHVGHPLGYIASDIVSRYKRLKGFNVLHPMGYDAFGLPAEQYAIQTGQHPAVTTQQNIACYREQLDKIGFCYDWNREVRTCDPSYYKWTQWAFIQMYNHYYDVELDKAMPIEHLTQKFAAADTFGWNSLSASAQNEILERDYRLAYQAVTSVNWCEALGTVLANDEVKEGLSVRGGHPVEQKPMKQWLLRVTSYAQRFLDGLENVDWSDSLKEIQRNWIGRSQGATMFFPIDGSDRQLEIFTTRCDTTFGVTFMVLAPEHPWVGDITTDAQRADIEEYISATKKRSERERMAETRVSGCFTGGYALNPFNGTKIPIYISDYVLSGYGTGAIMAVPAHDSRDYAFARHFDLPIVPIIECDVTEQSYDAKEGRLINSEFLNGLEVKEAIEKMLTTIESQGIGSRKINYRLRDAIFSRQRYWGEPFPVYYEGGVARMISLDELPLELPSIENFTPTSAGEPPLARVEGWKYETSTMPGFAGSSAYYLRYMDPHNSEALVSKEANEYWQSVDLYVGGIEHATGHLIYSRFWKKFLYDLGYICQDEPYKKLVNQGMIQGRSNFVYRIKGTNTFVSATIKDQHDTQEIHVDVNIVKNDILDLEAFKAWRPEFSDAEFILDDDKYTCGWAVEKMSKSMYNVVNPDMIVENYGADTLRMYEMFLGPLEQSKPWDTNGIDGVHKFLRRLWRAVEGANDAKATPENLKTLHKTIKKVSEDIENFSFNTAVSAFMICLNELTSQKATSADIFKELTVLLAPFTPHIAEEIWAQLSPKGSVCDAQWPVYNEEYLVEKSFEYPVSMNGKMRYKLPLALDLTAAEVEAIVREHENTLRYTESRPIKKVIVVLGRIINIVY